MKRNFSIIPFGTMARRLHYCPTTNIESFSEALRIQELCYSYYWVDSYISVSI